MCSCADGEDAQSSTLHSNPPFFSTGLSWERWCFVDHLKTKLINFNSSFVSFF